MKNKHPDREECLRMLQEYETPEHVIRHCEAVTNAALKIASALNEKGFDFNIPLIQAAGLLHDIARIHEEHWHVGADFVRQNGYVQEAEIVKMHMTHAFHLDPSELKELDIVCLGDRLIMEDKYAGIDARMDYVIKKANGNKRIEQMINERRIVNNILVQNIEDIIGISLEDLILGPDKQGGRPLHEF
ncbi:MAG: HD domain-containing protein [Clostridiales bacterium]|nr:HD domain-containing protein [Clostridiales bacterium]